MNKVVAGQQCHEGVPATISRNLLATDAKWQDPEQSCEMGRR